MDNSIYITLSKQLAAFRDMSVTANNIANANTTGYHSEHMLFNSYLTHDVNQRDRNKMAFAHDISTYHNLDERPINATGNNLDLAISSDGFFSIETPLGIRYTRAGNFQLDAQGSLVTVDGDAVLNSSGQKITFPAEVADIKVGAAGNISVNGEEFATIGIYQFSNPQLLERTSGAMFRSDIAPTLLTDAKVVQGALNSANVKPVLELTHMIEVTRSVGSTAKMIEVIYDLQRKANNTWAQNAQ